ncbi:MAG: iron-sulfur cluster assembly accessory protein [Rhodobacterales bacterium]|nr:iron-sulfur cluster assembly accessory protein [Rhodobacterales bacterium]
MIDVSERAAKRIQEIIVEGKCEFSGLRVGLRDGGCAGYTYLLEFEPKPDEDDTVIDAHGAKIFVHPLHAPFLMGSTLRWAEEEFQSGFHVDNPNVSRSCGCGESFDV